MPDRNPGRLGDGLNGVTVRLPKLAKKLTELTHDERLIPKVGLILPNQRLLSTPEPGR